MSYTDFDEINFRTLYNRNICNAMVKIIENMELSSRQKRKTGYFVPVRKLEVSRTSETIAIPKVSSTIGSGGSGITSSLWAFLCLSK
mmetsp:Transcript_22952/g.53701  ORF Transcript_22952/g.53701 Transcript_22952/m.53701 type:complete len:87 (+) Transcript_22952:849-1109(+)